jgi:hypothetical protein
VQQLRAEGFATVRAIAAEPNRKGVKTAAGAQWHATSVQRLLKRLG